MKFIYFTLALLLTSACSTHKNSSSDESLERKPNSLFECYFEKTIDKQTVKFSFNPEERLLFVNDVKVELEEKDLAPGAFVYTTSKKENEWKMQVDFISYERTPAVALKVDKSPLFSPTSIRSRCGRLN